MSEKLREIRLGLLVSLKVFRADYQVFHDFCMQVEQGREMQTNSKNWTFSSPEKNHTMKHKISNLGEIYYGY